MADSPQKEINNKERYIKKLIAEKKELIDRIEFKDQEISDVLAYAGVAIIETTGDLRIINTLGAVDIIFNEVAEKVTRGGNLMILVKKATKSVKQKNEDNETEDIEKTVEKFIQGKKDETVIDIVGSNFDEIFLLSWKINRMGNHFRHYFKIIPTNKFVNEAKKDFQKKIQSYKDFVQKIFNEMHDGITIINMSNKIEMINQSAQKMFLPAQSKIMERTSLEGKFFSDLFLNEEAEKARYRVEMHNEALVSKETKVYELETFDKNIRFKAIPDIDEEGKVNGIILVSSLIGSSKVTDDTDDRIKTLTQTVRTLNESSNAMKERIKELEYNHKWFMNKRREDSRTIKQYHKTIKAIYTYLENLPSPISILVYPDYKYQFINKEFEKHLGKKRKEILGKVDKQICEKDTYEKIKKLNEKAKKESGPASVKAGKTVIKQIFLKDENDNVTHILRTYNI